MESLREVGAQRQTEVVRGRSDRPWSPIWALGELEIAPFDRAQVFRQFENRQIHMCAEERQLGSDAGELACSDISDFPGMEHVPGNLWPGHMRFFQREPLLTNANIA
jgi:hypothetical protein